MYSVVELQQEQVVWGFKVLCSTLICCRLIGSYLTTAVNGTSHLYLDSPCQCVSHALSSFVSARKHARYISGDKRHMVPEMDHDDLAVRTYALQHNRLCRQYASSYLEPWGTLFSIYWTRMAYKLPFLTILVGVCFHPDNVSKPRTQNHSYSCIVMQYIDAALQLTQFLCFACE